MIRFNPVAATSPIVLATPACADPSTKLAVRIEAARSRSGMPGIVERLRRITAASVSPPADFRFRNLLLVPEVAE